MSLESRIDGIEARIHEGNVGLPINNGPPFTRPTLNSSSRGRLALALPRQQMKPNETEIKLNEIMKASGIIKINGLDYRTDMKDLREMELLGDGTSGHVVKMLHIPSDTVIAVKQMRRTGNPEENKRIVNDIETALKAHGCPYIVQCLGFIITSADVWICMELMATCFDKLLKRTSRPVPEEILGKVTVAVVKALSFLKDKDTMHRDVKPSNILVDEAGVIKLCDFGISGQLNNSKAKTRSAGCVAYLAPERIDPNKSEYDIRADVWSLGITLVELATGKFPYQDCRTDFEVLTCVMQSDPPKLPSDQGFSLEFQNFVKRCLIHDVNRRPKYKDLLLLPFFICYDSKPVNVASWLKGALKLAGLVTQRDQQPPTPNDDNESVGYHHQQTVRPPQHRIFDPQPIHVPERHPFAKPSPVVPEKQYCNMTVISPEGPSRLPSYNQYPSHFEPPPVAPPEQGPVKVYRKSPFLPRKKDNAESGVTPKKESKLSTLGSSLLKNFTTSPFSQRKQPVPQPELPPFMADKRSTTNFPSHHRPVESRNCQLPRQIFQNSPILQRRNPSYVENSSAVGHSKGGRGSANTSPIVLQRFYHQQNQLRDKIGDEGSMSSSASVPVDRSANDHIDHSNPFLGGSYGHQTRARVQPPWSDREMQHSDREGGVSRLNLACGDAPHELFSSSKVQPEDSASHMAHSQFTAYATTTTVEQNFEQKATPPMFCDAAQEGSSTWMKPATNGKTYEKNLGWFNSFAGDVKRRFASYLKVNLSEERRLRTEEFSYQAAAAEQNSSAPQTFASTNPFLDPADHVLAPAEVAEKSKLDRRHRSPDPPPRFNRQSPLLLRKKLEMTNWGGSPLLTRRIITGSPPGQQQQHRDCESVPGSPQHFRTRIHYTPEPQRRFYRP